jgi:hypothetical protein
MGAGTLALIEMAAGALELIETGAGLPELIETGAGPPRAAAEPGLVSFLKKGESSATESARTQSAMP